MMSCSELQRSGLSKPVSHANRIHVFCYMLGSASLGDSRTSYIFMNDWPHRLPSLRGSQTFKATLHPGNIFYNVATHIFGKIRNLLLFLEKENSWILTKLQKCYFLPNLDLDNRYWHVVHKLWKLCFCGSFKHNGFTEPTLRISALTVALTFNKGYDNQFIYIGEAQLYVKHAFINEP